MQIYIEKKERRGRVKTFRVKLMPSDDFWYLNNIIDISGIIWNFCINAIKSYYKDTRLLLDKFELQKTLTSFKKTKDGEYFSLVPSQAVQDVTDRIYRSYKLFFSNKKKGIKSSPPKRHKVS